MFRPGEQPNTKDISIECGSLLDNGPFTERFWNPPEEEDKFEPLPEFLEISLGFTDRPDMSKISLQVAASGTFFSSAVWPWPM